MKLLMFYTTDFWLPCLNSMISQHKMYDSFKSLRLGAFKLGICLANLIYRREIPK